MSDNAETETAILAGGCFWGVQELLRHRDGVISTRAGYTGGENDNPTYRNHPGHAEAVEIAAVTDVFRAAETARSVEQALGFAYGARDWMQMNRNLFSALKLEKTMMFLLLVLITIVASFNIVSTLTMIVTEKQKEIAILKAMGATRKSIRRIFMLNGLIIGLSGTTIGIPLGYAFLWLIQTFWTFDPSVYYISQIPVHVQAMDVLLVAGSAIVISFAATVYPSLQAARARTSGRAALRMIMSPPPSFLFHSGAPA